MKRVEENLGSIGNSKVNYIEGVLSVLNTAVYIYADIIFQARSVHNTVMELRNICNHPYLSQLHADEVCFLVCTEVYFDLYKQLSRTIERKYF